MFKKLMLIIIALMFSIKALGLAAQFIFGTVEATPTILIILCAVWLIAGVALFIIEKLKKLTPEKLSLFFGFDMVYTAFTLIYSGLINMFDVSWYHLLMIGTILNIIVDDIFILLAVLRMKQKKYIKISQEALKNDGQNE